MSHLTQLVRVRRLAASGTARVIRETAGLSLREVAREIGVDRSTLSRWERGIRRPRRTEALRWARILEELAG